MTDKYEGVYIYISTQYMYTYVYIYTNVRYTLFTTYICFLKWSYAFLKHRDDACDVVVDGGGGDAPLHCTSTHLRIDRYHEWKT